MLESKDLIIGECYALKFSDLPYEWLIRIGSDKGSNDRGIFNSSSPYYQAMCNFGGKNYSNGKSSLFRLLTREERAWLEACERANKFIELKDVKQDLIINNYEVY